MATSQPSAQDMRKAVESFYADISDRHDMTKVPLLLTPGFTLRGSVGPTVVGHDDFIAYLDVVRHAIDNYHCEILDLVVEAPIVSVRTQNSGFHRGDMYGWQASGKKLQWASTAIFTFDGGQIADLCVMGDLPGFGLGSSESGG